MKVYRCRICSEPYVGRGKPPNCPFCGAAEKYVVLARNWKEDMISTLTDVSEKNLKTALRFEIDKSGFYRCAARVAADEEVKAIFSAISRIEAGHASTVRRMLGLPRSSRFEHEGRCYPTDDQNLEEALRREELAVSLYEEAAKQASEKRVREVLLALTEVEKEHAAIASRKM